jgi:hypothetical protein
MFSCHCSDDCSRLQKELFCSADGVLCSCKTKRKVGREGLLALSITVLDHICPFIDECVQLASEARKVLA